MSIENDGLTNGVIGWLNSIQGRAVELIHGAFDTSLSGGFAARPDLTQARGAMQPLVLLEEEDDRVAVRSPLVNSDSPVEQSYRMTNGKCSWIRYVLMHTLIRVIS